MQPVADLEVHQNLLRRFMAGDAEACRKVQRWAWHVVRFGGYGIGPDEYDDLVQDTLIATWKACSKPGFSLHTSLQGLVRKVAMARCIDYVRARRRMAEMDENLVDPNPGPQELRLQAEDQDRVRWAIERLGPSFQEIIRLHFLEGLTYAEIASRLGRAEATLRVRMFHCIREIRRLLERAEATPRRATAH